jgi:hypothetical protein
MHTSCSIPGWSVHVHGTGSQGIGDDWSRRMWGAIMGDRSRSASNSAPRQTGRGVRAKDTPPTPGDTVSVLPPEFKGLLGCVWRRVMPLKKGKSRKVVSGNVEEDKG